MTETIQRIAPADWREQIIIRRLRHEDLPALEWEGEYRRFRQVYADTYQRMRRGKASMWVAVLPDRGVIGQVFIQFSCDRKELADGISRAYFFSFRVRPEFRSAGVGAKLLQAVEEETLSRRMRWLCLNVAKDNLRGQQFYARHGYELVADEPGTWYYKDDDGNLQQVHEPAGRMEKDLFASG